MSKLYWMDQVIATDSSEYISFVPGSLSGITATTVGGAIREVATTKTGIKMSKALAEGTTTFSFTNVNFNNDMYVDYFCDKAIALLQPTYSETTKTITFECSAVKEDCTFKIVVKF